MSHWDFLIDEGALAAVLPGPYARFARPVRGALAVFLGGLPAEHQQAVLAEQAGLPPDASPEQRLGVLARCCPALHKLGQILARDRRLSPEFRRHLQDLESLPPSVPLDAVRATLDRELGPLERRGVTLTPPALAEASVAVVVPFRQDGPVAEGRPREGVFKVLKPGVEERLGQELELLGRVGDYLDASCDELGIPHLDYREAFDQVRDKLRHEVRLDLEQEHLARARRLYAGDPRVLVPELLPHCSPRVTAMERVTGGKVTDHRPESPPGRRRLAGLIVEALVARPVFAPDGAGLFHGDPHAGNLFLTADGRLAVLDWSLTGLLGERERAALSLLPLAALTLRPERIVATLADLGGGRGVDGPALETTVANWLARVRRGQFPGFSWVTGLLDEAVQTARLRVGPDLLLFRKTLLTLEGVTADVAGGEARPDEILAGEFLRHLVAEWPCRWLAPPGWRSFPTRLSNADLTRFLWHLPWAAAEVWLEQLRGRLAEG